MLPLTKTQLSLIEAPINSKIFIEGPAGAGKTTVGVERLIHLLERGISGHTILIIVPQRTLALPYYRVLRDPGLAPGGVVDVLTIGGLARHMVELFWPLVAEEAGFGHPDRPPTFLNIETAQFHMGRIVRPLLLDEGYFESVTIDRNRLYSQILDNLNKSAFVGFPHSEIAERLNDAWIDQESQRRIYVDTQECANRFRKYCLANNLLDFSLWLEVFREYIWSNPQSRQYLFSRYAHLIADNLEEDTPVAHDILADWLPHFESALLIYDWEAGYRRFLGADPKSAYRFKDLCQEKFTLTQSKVATPEIESFRQQFSLAMGFSDDKRLPGVLSAIHFEHHRFYPEMLDWVADQIARLVFEEGLSPGEIVVLAPYLSDALRFSLMNRLENAGIPTQSHRPSRSLREEPAAQCLLTLAAIAHPTWNIRASHFDVANALTQAIAELDLVRAQLLTEVLYRTQGGTPSLGAFEGVKPEMQERITYLLGQRYEELRHWIEVYSTHSQEHLDHFLSRLFGEVLSQPGYQFHQDFDSGKVAANLIDSARNFRWAVGDIIEAEGEPTGKIFLQMVQDGIIASQYIASWDLQVEDAILLAPAYTFLMSNQPVEVQFWLNANSHGWWERLFQPLTHPYVLSRNWPKGRPWTDNDEVTANQEAMHRLVTGLLRRCSREIYLGLSSFDEHGFEQKGPLLKVIQNVLRTVSHG